MRKLKCTEVKQLKAAQLVCGTAGTRTVVFDAKRMLLSTTFNWVLGLPIIPRILLAGNSGTDMAHMLNWILFLKFFFRDIGSFHYGILWSSFTVNSYFFSPIHCFNDIVFNSRYCRLWVKHSRLHVHKNSLDMQLPSNFEANLDWMLKFKEVRDRKGKGTCWELWCASN